MELERSLRERLNPTILTLTVPSKRLPKRLQSRESVSEYPYSDSRRTEAPTEVLHCRGIFFYESDNQEVDIELLSSYYEKGYKV